MPVYGYLGVLSPYSAQCLVLSGPRCALATEFASSIPLSWCRGRFPWSCCSADHSTSPVAALGQGDRWPCCAVRAVFRVVHMPVVCNDRCSVSQLQFVNQIVDFPVVVQRPIPMVLPVQKTIETTQLQYVSRWLMSLLCRSSRFFVAVCGRQSSSHSAARRIRTWTRSLSSLSWLRCRCPWSVFHSDSPFAVH